MYAHTYIYTVADECIHAAKRRENQKQTRKSELIKRANRNVTEAVTMIAPVLKINQYMHNF